MGSKRPTPHWLFQGKMSTRYRLMKWKRWGVDTRLAGSAKAATDGCRKTDGADCHQTSCDSRKSILVGWHHLPTRPASSVSRQQQKLCWWDTAEPPASICLSFMSSACPSCLLSVLHVFLPKLKKSFHEILTTVCHSNCMLSSKTSTDSKHTGGLGRVRLSTVALPSRGHLQQVGRDILSYVISLLKWPIYAKSLGLRQ